jgi:glycerophosphoryl diester phosphodiesterase
LNMSSCPARLLSYCLIAMALTEVVAATSPADPFQTCCKRIAHAGGAINSATYTNSREALLHNLERGFEDFELDFIWTSDRRLVTLHDWDGNAQRAFNHPVTEPPDLATFQAWLEKASPYPPMTLAALAQLMEEQPSIRVITDVKQHNLEALRIIHRELPDASGRVIPQIYTPQEYAEVKAIGYQQVIWTLYRYPGSNDQVLAELGAMNLKKMELYAVTLTAERARDGLAQAIRAQGIPVYAHTINTVPELLLLQEQYAVTDVYTDVLNHGGYNDNLWQWACPGLSEPPSPADQSPDTVGWAPFNLLLKLPPVANPPEDASANTDTVQQLYKRLFGRHVDNTGLMFWKQQLRDQEQTAMQLAWQLYYSASGSDRVVVSNRLRVIYAWLRTRGAEPTGSNLPPALQSLIDSVTPASPDPGPACRKLVSSLNPVGQ